MNVLACNPDFDHKMCATEDTSELNEIGGTFGEMPNFATLLNRHGSKLLTAGIVLGSSLVQKRKAGSPRGLTMPEYHGVWPVVQRCSRSCEPNMGRAGRRSRRPIGHVLGGLTFQSHAVRLHAPIETRRFSERDRFMWGVVLNVLVTFAGLALGLAWCFGLAVVDWAAWYLVLPSRKLGSLAQELDLVDEERSLGRADRGDGSRWRETGRSLARAGTHESGRTWPYCAPVAWICGRPDNAPRSHGGARAAWLERRCARHAGPRPKWWRPLIL